MKSVEQVNKQRYSKYNRESHAGKRSANNNQRQVEMKQQKCYRCGSSHGSSCPAKNTLCHRCKKRGHYARCCKTKQVTEVNCKYTQSSKSSEEEFFIGTMTDINDDPRRWLVHLQVNSHDVKFKIDSGADVSVMSLSTYGNLHNPPVRGPKSHRLKRVNGALKC